MPGIRNLTARSRRSAAPHASACFTGRRPPRRRSECQGGRRGGHRAWRVKRCGRGSRRRGRRRKLGPRRRLARRQARGLCPRAGRRGGLHRGGVSRAARPRARAAGGAHVRGQGFAPRRRALSSTGRLSARPGPRWRRSPVPSRVRTAHRPARARVRPRAAGASRHRGATGQPAADRGGRSSCRTPPRSDGRDARSTRVRTGMSPAGVLYRPVCPFGRRP
jgi:hypothetical protein